MSKRCNAEREHARLSTAVDRLARAASQSGNLAARRFLLITGCDLLDQALRFHAPPAPPRDAIRTAHGPT